MIGTRTSSSYTPHVDVDPADRPLIPVTRRRPYDLAWSKQALPDTPDSTVERICEYARRVARAQP